MTDFLLLLLIGICWTWGINCLFTDGYILGAAGNYIRKQLPIWALKPTIDCPPCMASFHGFFIAGTMYYYDWMMTILYMVCLCGVNYILVRIFPEYE